MENQVTVQSRPIDIYELFGVFFPGVITLISTALIATLVLPEISIQTLRAHTDGLSPIAAAIAGLYFILLSYLIGQCVISFAIIINDEIIQRRIVGEAFVWLLSSEKARAKFKLPEYDLTRIACASALVAIGASFLGHFKISLTAIVVSLVCFLCRAFLINVLLSFEKDWFGRELLNYDPAVLENNKESEIDAILLAKQKLNELRSVIGLGVIIRNTFAARVASELTDLKKSLAPSLQQRRSAAIRESFGLMGQKSQGRKEKKLRALSWLVTSIELVTKPIGKLLRMFERISFSLLRIYRPLPAIVHNMFFSRLALLTNGKVKDSSLEGFDEAVRHFIMQMLGNMDFEQSQRSKRNYYLFRITRNSSGALLISSIILAFGLHWHQAFSIESMAFGIALLVGFGALSVRAIFLYYRVYHKELFMSLAAVPEKMLRKYVECNHGASKAPGASGEGSS